MIRLFVLWAFLSLTTLSWAQAQGSPGDALRQLPSGPNRSRTPQQEEVSLDGYRIPQLFKLIFDGRLDEVPDDTDTRSYVTALIKVGNETCGDDSTFDFGLRVMKYMLSGGINLPLKEGIDDGRLFYSQLRCVSPQARKLRDNIEKLITLRAARSPNPADKARLDALIRGEAPAAALTSPDLGGNTLSEDGVKVLTEHFGYVYGVLTACGGRENLSASTPGHPHYADFQAFVQANSKWIDASKRAATIRKLNIEQLLQRGVLIGLGKIADEAKANNQSSQDLCLEARVAQVRNGSLNFDRSPEVLAAVRNDSRAVAGITLYQQTSSKIYGGVIAGNCIIRSSNPACAKVKELLSSDQQIIRCVYGPTNTDGTGILQYEFWQGTVPDNLPSYAVPGEDHPLSRLGTRAVESCPRNASDAQRLRDSARLR